METDLSLNLNLKDTELTLGLPGTHSTDSSNESESPPTTTTASPTTTTTTARPQKRPAPPTSAGSDPPSQPKAQVVGWPPIRSYRKNNLQPNHQVNKKKEETSTVESNTNTNLEESAAVQNYVKVSMDGAPFLRKIDLNGYKGGYPDLLKGLETMFKFTVGHYSEREGYKGSEFVPTYEDKDGDWMLVGDVPWEMFLSTCKRLRIMKGSEAKGLGCV